MAHSPFEETLRCLKADSHDSDRLLLIEPHLLYLSEEQSDRYLDAMNNPDYVNAFHSPTVQLIREHLDEILDDVTSEVSLIDLGPGFPDKSLPIAHEFQQRGIALDYYPVDISEPFLSIAAREMADFSRRTTPIHASFEECARLIAPHLRTEEILCMIGLTFMNFPPEEILPRLKEISAGRGQTLLASELVTKTNSTERILSHYRNAQTESVAFGPLKNLGFNPEAVRYEVAFNNSRVEMQFVVSNIPPDVQRRTSIHPGQRIVTAISYRYTHLELEQLLENTHSSHRTFLSSDKTTALVIGEL